MKVSEKTRSVNASQKGFAYEPSLDNLPIPAIAIEKAKKALKTLRKHPFPDHLKRR